MQTYLNVQCSLKSQSFIINSFASSEAITGVELGLFIVVGFSVGQGGGHRA